MPITRRDESPDPLDRYLLLLWKSRWIIIGAAIATAILIYVVLLFVPSKYRVESELFVNQIPSRENGTVPNPDSVVALLESKSVIDKVRQDYVKAFDLEAAPPIERFSKQFTVKSQTLQDTSVRKEFSPVLALQVESSGSSETRFLMESWLRNSVKLFGNYTVSEAVTKRDAYLARLIQIEEKLTELTIQKNESEARLPYLEKILAEYLDLLSPSHLHNGGDGVNLNLAFENQRISPGLIERRTEIILNTRAGTASSTAAAELAALDLAIAETRTSITAAQEALAEEQARSETIGQQLNLLLANQGAVNDALSKFIVASSIYKEVADTGIPEGGDIRALALPVTPDERIWPKRTSTAAVAAIVVAVLTTFILLGRDFLVRLENKHKGQT